MIKIKKGEIVSVLQQIAVYNEKSGVLAGGLLAETIKLSTKRGLTKIRVDLLKAHQELTKDIIEIKKACEENKELEKEELEFLLEEELVINQPKRKFTEIDEVVSSAVYNFILLEKIFED